MKHLIVFILLSFGFFSLIQGFSRTVYKPAAKALRMRGKKKLTSTEVFTIALAEKLTQFISIDPIKRSRLAEDLRSLGHTEAPELYLAKAWARAVIYSLFVVWMVLLSPAFGLGLTAFVLFYSYKSQTKKLRNEIQERREKIERELPQLSGTIRQSLNSTRDVVGILESYRKVCGKTLLTEIDRTLNDIKTGNPERALKAFESRVSSAKLSEIIRGLISVMRGDDQRNYFEILAIEHQKAQNEAVKKELLRRPEKLNINMAALFICMIAMVAVAIGLYMIQQTGNFM